MKNIFIGLLLMVGLGGCASLTGKDEASTEFEKMTSLEDARVAEDKARTALRQLESALTDYIKTVKRIPTKLDLLVPKYIAEIPPLDLPVCGKETDAVEYYPASILKGGQVDGGAITGTGRWGYVIGGGRVVVFIDCLKPSRKGVPWYQERGVY
jgi:uncharacterized protein YceK